ncbi:MAG TPA: neutral zinc metallopeptidase, partial [Acidimicrobiales bacterium]|nr:neutral zinc metallopeptidase [Acidimicrobiales bacterium]
GGDDGGSGDESGSAEEAASGSEDIEVDEEPEEEEDLSEEEVIENLQEYWDDEGDTIGLAYEPVDEDRIQSIEEGELPVCEGFPIPAEQIEDNAFAFGCPEGNAVVWDPDLFEDFTEEYGETGPAVVLAHEFGHVVQFQTLVWEDHPSIFKENQADCYAGAWVAEQVEDGYGPFSDPGSIDRAVAAALEIGDPVGSSPDDQFAHGSGFDRVRAFQDGFDQGVDYCYGYLEDPPFIDQIPFGSEEDAINQGNLPFDEVTELVVDDLGDYFGDNVDDFEDPTTRSSSTTRTTSRSCTRRSATARWPRSSA